MTGEILAIRLKKTKEHITNMNAWIDLEIRLLKNKTIDKNVQEQINKEKDHWRKVLLRILDVIKNLGKNNLAFQGKNKKIYQENNGNFLKSNWSDCRIWSSNARTCSMYLTWCNS